MQEAFLHFIWQYQYFDKKDLKSTDKEIINILRTGHLNNHSGPDFHEAQIDINGIVWGGNVEIHIKSSDWNYHNHQTDRAYDNVVLHVVWQHDKEVKRSDGTTIPTIELDNRVNQDLYQNYNDLIRNPVDIPCHTRLSEVDDIVTHSMIAKVLMERMHEKAQRVQALQHDNANNWNETAYQLLASNFGFKINAEPFLELSKCLPLKLLQKHRDNILYLEALLFGQAGFLDENIEDNYYLQLQKEYRFLQHKYNLSQVLNKFRWKFMRLRPANFPTIRIAQFAMLIQNTDSLFDLMTEDNNIERLFAGLTNKQSTYWTRHYNFGKASKSTIAGFGKSSSHNIVINSVVPLLFAYSRQIDEEIFRERGISLLEQLPGEQNSVIKKWKERGVDVKSSFDTQGLIQLNSHYCIKKRCLRCNIGTSLVRKN